MRKMIKYVLTSLFVLICSIVSQAQLYDKVWVVGAPGYTFTFDSINVLSDTLPHRISTYYSWANICDESGNLEFFTNGVGVYTKDSRNNNDGILNSQGITDPGFEQTFASSGAPVSHADLIFPRGNRKYYLVCQSVSDSQLAHNYIPDNLYFAEVDMNANSGLGAVTSKKNLLYHGLMTQELIAACKHGNGRDYWLVVNGYQDSTYIKFLVTPDTILGPFFQSIGSVYGFPIVGQISFAADGSKMAGVNAQSKLNIFDFDRCSGIFTHSIVLDIPLDTIYDDSTHTVFEQVAGLGGISVNFSPSGRYLYYSNRYEIYQYDLQNADIAGSRNRIYLWKLADGGEELGDSYLSPNGQIIVAHWNTGNNVRGMNVITLPDLPNSGCAFVIDTPSLYADNSRILSNTFNYRLGKKLGSGCDTLTGIEQVGVNSIQTKLYPNPASEMVQLDLYTRDLSEPLCFVVYDMVGKEILRQTIPMYSIQIQRGSIVTGVYNWQIQSNKGQIRANGKLVWE